MPGDTTGVRVKEGNVLCLCFESSTLPTVLRIDYGWGLDIRTGRMRETSKEVIAMIQGKDDDFRYGTREEMIKISNILYIF